MKAFLNLAKTHFDLKIRTLVLASLLLTSAIILPIPTLSILSADIDLFAIGPLVICSIAMQLSSGSLG